MMPHNLTREEHHIVEAVTFEQLRMLTMASCRRLRSFDRQFSGCPEVIA
jgi:hypothetical protein